MCVIDLLKHNEINERPEVKGQDEVEANTIRWRRTEDVECPGVLQVTALEGGGVGAAGQGLPGVLHQRRERERGGGGVAVPCRLQQRELKVVCTEASKYDRAIQNF